MNRDLIMPCEASNDPMPYCCCWWCDALNDSDENPLNLAGAATIWWWYDEPTCGTLPVACRKGATPSGLEDAANEEVSGSDEDEEDHGGG